MSRSTITFGLHSITGGTPVVEVVCGFLLQGLHNKPTDHDSAIGVIKKDLEYYLGTEFGFISIALPDLNDNDLDLFADVVSRCIRQIETWGDQIPLSEVDRMQDEGFLPKEARYTRDMPTDYILDYFIQLKRMLAIPATYTAPEEDRVTHYPIKKNQINQFLNRK